MIFEDKVIVNGDHDGDAWIAALSRKDGTTLWKITRENKTRSYCTPLIRDLAGRTQMILSGSKCVASYDPDTGKPRLLNLDEELALGVGGHRGVPPHRRLLQGSITCRMTLLERVVRLGSTAGLPGCGARSW